MNRNKLIASCCCAWGGCALLGTITTMPDITTMFVGAVGILGVFFGGYFIREVRE